MRKNEEFKPFLLSIYKLCKKKDKISYFNQIRNRILRLIEEDKTLGDFVKYDSNSTNDMYLDDEGICIFSNILTGYFEEQLIKDIWMYIRNLNQYSQNEYELHCMFKRLSIPDLLKLIKESGKWNPEEENLKITKQSVIDRAREELKCRNIVDWDIAASETIIKKCNFKKEVM